MKRSETDSKLKTVLLVNASGNSSEVAFCAFHDLDTDACPMMPAREYLLWPLNREDVRVRSGQFKKIIRILEQRDLKQLHKHSCLREMTVFLLEEDKNLMTGASFINSESLQTSGEIFCAGSGLEKQ